MIHTIYLNSAKKVEKAGCDTFVILLQQLRDTLSFILGYK